jgi:hypothetical protein
LIVLGLVASPLLVYALAWLPSGAGVDVGSGPVLAAVVVGPPVTLAAVSGFATGQRLPEIFILAVVFVGTTVLLAAVFLLYALSQAGLN